MFSSDDDDDWSLADSLAEIRASESRTTERECDICGFSKGSVVVRHDETHPEVAGDDGVARCKRCYNDPDTYPDGP